MLRNHVIESKQFDNEFSIQLRSCEKNVALYFNKELHSLVERNLNFRNCLNKLFVTPFRSSKANEVPSKIFLFTSSKRG